MPAVSVILPTYNRATVLRRAVDSVLAQDFADFDVIVVDDGSEDETSMLMQSYHDPRIIYVRQPVNRGGNVCRNHGIMLAQSEIILPEVSGLPRWSGPSPGATLFATHTPTQMVAAGL